MLIEACELNRSVRTCILIGDLEFVRKIQEISESQFCMFSVAVSTKY